MKYIFKIKYFRKFTNRESYDSPLCKKLSENSVWGENIAKDGKLFGEGFLKASGNVAFMKKGNTLTMWDFIINDLFLKDL